MTKYYCDYCDVLLTRDSPSVRKSHNLGRNHLLCVMTYYELGIGQDKAQAIFNVITHEYEKVRAVIPPPYNGQIGVPGYQLSRSFSGLPYLNPQLGFPLFRNMSTRRMNPSSRRPLSRRPSSTFNHSSGGFNLLPRPPLGNSSRPFNSSSPLSSPARID